jgi:hypothetical protein
MRYKRVITIAATVVTAASAMLPAAVRAGQPVIRDHESFIDLPSPGDWCGAVNGMWSGSGTFTFRQDASGAFHATQVERSVFRADATGKSIELQSAGVDMGIGVDNGDGTTTFTEHTAGLAVTLRIPGGPILMDADGKPLLGAGVIDSVVTIDNATGDIITGSETFHGPHPIRDGVDVCTPAIVYLTS